MPLAEALPMLLGIVALFVGLTKFFLDRYLAQIEKRFDQLEEALRSEAAGVTALREEFLRLKAELPLHYVRREDDIRNQTVINAKLDALYLKIEGLKEKV
ncbi:MAG: hypothetical protein OEY50_06205 [Nitrospinota bacterium]|nr:hypothetical protein [Nitrospinota bacterium]MDH5678744.1 hypothetical protein [Nitrospinota bacterium]MDH5757643.1 hypothetical protein [Nitrospinota bacterium]